MNKLYGVYRSAAEIPWDELPKQFVLKCNHGCGYNIIVRDKDQLDKEKAAEKLDGWLKQNYGLLSGEHQYKDIPPRIIAEAFLENEDGSLPCDYKFMCANGRPLYCLILTGHDENRKRAFVGEHFEDLHLISGDVLDVLEDIESYRPVCYSEMWKLAERLCKAFPVVRVDLYNVKGKVIFGEYTFTPRGCNHFYFNEEVQRILGSQIMMPGS